LRNKNPVSTIIAIFYWRKFCSDFEKERSEFVMWGPGPWMIPMWGFWWIFPVIGLLIFLVFIVRMIIGVAISCACITTIAKRQLGFAVRWKPYVSK
jgi:hypothetical protein